MSEKMRKVGAFWHKTSQKGTNFYSGKLDAQAVKDALAAGETSLLLFKSKNPGGKRPDLEMFAVPPYEKRDDEREHDQRRPSRDSDADGYGDLP